MKKFAMSLGLSAIFLMSGCTYKLVETPASMKYDGTKTDYSNFDNWKKVEVCYNIADGHGDISIAKAAKKAGISHIKHIDSEIKYNKFLFWNTNYKKCVIVYGE